MSVTCDTPMLSLMMCGMTEMNSLFRDLPFAFPYKKIEFKTFKISLCLCKWGTKATGKTHTTFFFFLFFPIVIHHFLFERFITLLFYVQNAFVVAHEIKVHLNCLHCLVSYSCILNLAFMHHNVCAHDGSFRVRSCPYCPSSYVPLAWPPTACFLLSSREMGSYKHLPFSLCPLPFAVGFSP